MLQQSTLQFLRQLNKNNRKTWFDANRAKYDNARSDFANFIQALIDKFAATEPDIKNLKAKDCMFRINRDIRFSKDKSPYKNNFGAFVCKGGKKSPLAGYYFHCQPGAAFIGGGLWSPMPPALKKVRQEIDYCFDEFGQITKGKKFAKVYGDLSTSDEYRLQKVPQGFDKEAPAAEYLRLKSFVAMRPISDAELVSKDLVKISREAFEALAPMIAFLNRPLEDE
jgi:uncharacterized protein (TIGR02453 family)